MTSKGGTVCCYRGCSSKTGGDISLFTFPKDPEQTKLWLRACNREDLSDKSIIDLQRNYRLCEKHFEGKYISKGDTRKRLFANAIPTVFSHILKRSHEQDVVRETTGEKLPKVTILSDIVIVPEKKEQIKTTEIDINMPGCSSSQATGDLSEELTIDIPPGEMSSPLTSPVSTQTALSLSSNTPRKQKLRKKVKALRTMSLKKTEDGQERQWDVEDFFSMCDQFLNKPLSEIVKMQAVLKNREPVGRRYSPEYKQFALTLYFLGPRAYEFLKKILYLPSKRSLERMTGKLVCKPGLKNTAIFTAMEIKIKTMCEEEKHCILCIDEMALMSNLYYHTGRDEVVGLHDTGNERKELLYAQNACVIMARGLFSNWKQPIAYFFVNSQFNATELRNVIEETIIKLFDLGLEVDGLISDMGSNFIQLSRLLGVTAHNSEFIVGNRSIIYMFDTCHLIKATRTNFMTKSFSFDNKQTSWSFVETFYQQDKKQNYRCAPKLTDAHIYPSNFDKMRVKLATQVLSNTVASSMNTYMTLGALPGEAIGTIEVIEKFDKLFDLLNSSEIGHPNCFKNVFEGTEYQLNYINEMFEFLGTLKVLNNNGEDVTSKSRFITSWLITLNGIKNLWQKLSAAGFRYLKTRRVNQDCIENFFGNIRQQGGNCINPTPIQFERAYRKLFCQSYLHSNKMNCKDDLDELLQKISTSDLTTPIGESDDKQETKAISLPDYTYRNENITLQNAFTYVCGYLIKKALTVHSCEVCLEFSKESQELDASKLLMYFKAYDNKLDTYGGLKTPSEYFINYIYKLEQIFISHFDDIIIKSGISYTYFNIMEKIDFQHPCPQFPLTYILKLFIRLKIFYCLKFSNRDNKKKPKTNRKVIILSHI